MRTRKVVYICDHCGAFALEVPRQMFTFACITWKRA